MDMEAIRSQLREQIQSGKLDLGGHFHRSERFTHDQIRSSILFLGEYDLIEIEKLQKGESSEPVILPRFGDSTCDQCGEDVLFCHNGQSIYPEKPCPYPEGLPPFTFEINCPSGKFVVANDLRDCFPVMDRFSVNYAIGQKKTTESYAKIGLAHGFVSNTSPGVFRLSSDRFLIGRPAYDRKSFRYQGSLARPVASICTDLWWYSICDFDEYMRRKNSDHPHEVIQVNPGIYQFAHYTHTLDDVDDHRHPIIFAKFERIADPEDPIDLQESYRSLNFTAEQVISDKLKRHPLLYGTSVIRAADHLMCVIGNGTSHHPNGWLGSSTEIDGKSSGVAIPEFDCQFPWYPICRFSAIAEGVGLGEDDARFNESFVRLAFNIVRSILVHGVPRNYYEQPAYHDSQLRWAWHIYLRLKDRYPEQVPENCKDLPKPSIPEIDHVPEW